MKEQKKVFSTSLLPKIQIDVLNWFDVCTFKLVSNRLTFGLSLFGLIFVGVIYSSFHIYIKLSWIVHTWENCNQKNRNKQLFQKKRRKLLSPEHRSWELIEVKKYLHFNQKTV